MAFTTTPPATTNPMFTPENLLKMSAAMFAAPTFAQGLGGATDALSTSMTAAKEKQKEQDLRNQTAEMLAKNAPEIAENVRTGALSASDGLRLYYQQKKEAADDAKPEYLTENGKIIKLNKATGENEVVGDYSSPKIPAVAEEYNYAVSQGFKGSFQDYQRQKDAKPSDDFKTEQELWKNWRSDADVKEYQGVRNGFEKIRASASDPSGPKDLGIIFGYMKMLDPTSVVREGEQASVANSGGVPQQIMSWYNRALTGEKLPEQVRNDILKAAEGLYTESASNYEAVNAQVRDMAGRYNVDPQFITPAEKYEPLKLGGPPAEVTLPDGTQGTIRRTK